MTDPGERDADRAWLPVFVACFALFAALELALVPRLTNVHFGDVEFSGWSGPMGSRLLRGDRPYVDFILPIPPGSFVLLAGLEWLTGRLLLLPELALDALLHLGMGAVAYALARAVTSRKVAALTALGTLVTVVQINKECAYDHTAQLAAWGSVCLGLHAMTTADERRARRLFFLAGLLAAVTVVFKQSTAIGCLGGWILALGYLRAVDRERPLARAASELARGAALGLALVWLLLLLLGSTFGAFFHGVFWDGGALKGGLAFLVRNLFVDLFDYQTFPAPLALVAIFVLIGARLLRLRGSLHLGDEPGRRAAAPRSERVLVLLLFALGTATGFVLLRRGYPLEVAIALERLKQLKSLALVPACVIFAAHLVGPRGDGDSARTGHTLNAILLLGLSCTALHNTSAPEFRPFYDNNVIVPLTFLVSFVVLDRAALPAVSLGVLALLFMSVFGSKFFRATTATSPALSPYLSGMLVSDRGRTLDRMAEHVRAITRETDRVLVLPEDLEVESLIGRPRPDLRGAVVFVDQYPRRLLANDLARLSEDPPRVIVLHPARDEAWEGFFRIWSGRSAAADFIHHVERELLPRRYRVESSYGTTYLNGTEKLLVFVREDPEASP